MVEIDELRVALESLASIFDAMSVRWAVGGSLASAAHGEPRATNDIDIIAVLSEPQARELVARLGTDFYADADAASDAVRRRASFNIIDNRSFLKLDIFVPAHGPLGDGQLDRRVELEIFPSMRAIPVLAAEDIVLQKLVWYRTGGEVSDRQWRDIVAVLRATAGQRNDAYLDETSAVADLRALLDRARDEAA